MNKIKKYNGLKLSGTGSWQYNENGNSFINIIKIDEEKNYYNVIFSYWYINDGLYKHGYKYQEKITVTLSKTHIKEIINFLNDFI